MDPPLPPGYRFVPTDEDLITYYLLNKVSGEQLPSNSVIDGQVYGANAQLPGVSIANLFIKWENSGLVW